VFATTGEYVTGLISASGNITGTNILTGGLISATSNITSAANVAGANVISTGLVTATGNIVTTANVSGGNVLSSALIQGVTLSASGNVNGANITTTGSVSATGNLVGGNVTTGGLISSTGNITSGNVTTAGQLVSSVATGTAPLVITSTTLVPNLYVSRANVSDYDNVTTATTGTYYPQIVNAVTGTVAAYANSNLSFNAATGVLTASGYTTAGTVTAATVNAAAIGNSGALLTGTLQTAAQTNITSVGTLTGGTWNATSISTTYTDAKVTSVASRTGAVTLAQADISGLTTGSTPTFAGLTVGTGSITGGNIVNGNGNGIGNIGSSSVYFNTVFGKATTAQYADLAENYAADAEYTSGTVLEFGGANEVTLSVIPGSARVAGVVSTNPAHLMNSTLESQYVTALALTGRVPTSVVGTVRKGDMMVSAGNGAAQACATPAMGTVIGKALENFNGESGVIEIVVGRL
jgi:hypothetical protein